MNINLSQTAFVFPGQGSQKIGMGKLLSEKHTISKETYHQADDILGYSLSDISWNDTDGKLNATYYTQPALFVHSMAVMRVLEDKFPSILPKYASGHSLGQLSALTAFKVFSFEAGLKLVQRRGELMTEAGEESPGGMAAILGLSIEDVENLCNSISEYVQVANDNCPGQVVVSGSTKGIDEIIVQAKEHGARRAMKLAVSIAAHSKLMEKAQIKFAKAVAETPMSAPIIPIIGNVSAKPLTSQEDIQNELRDQLTSRVRWTESITYLRENNINTFLEIGTGSVLGGLLKRIDRKSISKPTGNPEELDSLVLE
jgi:[acyl-carrier-protein] S-malonyltransferase